MPLPLSLSGKIEVPTSDCTVLSDQAIVDSIVRALHKAKVQNIRQLGAEIEFRLPFPRLQLIGSELNPITSGEIEVLPSIEGTRIAYRIRFTRLLLFQCIGLPIMIAIIGSDEDLRNSFGIIVLALALWIAGFLGNTLYSAFCFRRLLRKAIEQSRSSAVDYRGSSTATFLCHHCNKPVSHNDRFCPNCGETLKKP